MWWLWVIAVLLICVAVCCLFGFINGIVISYLNVPAFIGTLGMQLIVYGVCLVYTNATPIGGYHGAYTIVAKGKLFGLIPYLFLIAIAVGLVMWFIYNMTPHGKYMYAIGGVSVNGGIGRISGVLIGVLVFEILKTCLQYLGVDTNYQYIAQGIVIVVAIALDIRKYIAKK